MIKNEDVVAGHRHDSKTTNLCNWVACWGNQAISLVFELVSNGLSVQFCQHSGPIKLNSLSDTSAILTIDTFSAAWRLVLRGGGFSPFEEFAAAVAGGIAAELADVLMAALGHHFGFLNGKTSLPSSILSLYWRSWAQLPSSKIPVCLCLLRQVEIKLAKLLPPAINLCQ